MQDYLALPSLTDMPVTVVAEPDEQVRRARYLDTVYLDTVYLDTVYFDTRRQAGLGLFAQGSAPPRDGVDPEAPGRRGQP